jgi:N-hydroxyarylamine O-acetyltransferase
LLHELGFAVSMIAATVNVKGEWYVEGSNASNIVHFNHADYLVNVGFGANTPRKPVAAKRYP